MNARTIAFLMLITVHIAPVDARAQQPRVAPGARVRVTVPGEGSAPLVGTITEIGDDRLMLEVQGQATPMELLFTSVSKLEISKGETYFGFWKGAGIGFLVGAVVGATIGLASGDEGSGIVIMSAEEKALAAGGMLGILGALVGGGIGSSVSRGEGWTEVSKPFTGLTLGITQWRHGGLFFEISRPF